MISKQYEILGVSEYATDEEIKQKYDELVAKYREDRFLDGEAGNEAAKKLTEVEAAYAEIVDYRRQNSTADNGLMKEVDAALKAGDIRLAQEKLDAFNERTAEWHYLQAVVFYKKNWTNESKKQLEIAMQMDESNQKYKDAYDKLVMKMNAKPDDWNRQTSGNGGTYSTEEPQMGGDSCLDFCCRLAICNTLLNCCCNSCH